MARSSWTFSLCTILHRCLLHVPHWQLPPDVSSSAAFTNYLSYGCPTKAWHLGHHYLQNYKLIGLTDEPAINFLWHRNVVFQRIFSSNFPSLRHGIRNREIFAIFLDAIHDLLMFQLVTPLLHLLLNLLKDHNFFALEIFPLSFTLWPFSSSKLVLLQIWGHIIFTPVFVSIKSQRMKGCRGSWRL